MSSDKKIAFNMAILAGELDECKMFIREGLSVKSMTGEVKKSPVREIELLLNFVDKRRSEEFSDEEIYRLVKDRLSDSLATLEMAGVKGMKQILKDQQERVESFRQRPV